MKKGLMLLFFLAFISSPAFADGFFSSGEGTAIDKGSKIFTGSFSFSTSGGKLYGTERITDLWTSYSHG